MLDHLTLAGHTQHNHGYNTKTFWLATIHVASCSHQRCNHNDDLLHGTQVDNAYNTNPSLRETSLSSTCSAQPDNHKEHCMIDLPDDRMFFFFFSCRRMLELDKLDDYRNIPHSRVDSTKTFWKQTNLSATLTLQPGNHMAHCCMLEDLALNQNNRDHTSGNTNSFWKGTNLFATCTIQPGNHMDDCSLNVEAHCMLDVGMLDVETPHTRCGHSDSTKPSSCGTIPLANDALPRYSHTDESIVYALHQESFHTFLDFRSTKPSWCSTIPR